MSESKPAADMTLSELEALLELATPEPWAKGEDASGGSTVGTSRNLVRLIGGEAYVVAEFSGLPPNNRDLCLALRNHARALIGRTRAAEALVDILKQRGGTQPGAAGRWIIEANKRADAWRKAVEEMEGE